VVVDRIHTLQTEPRRQTRRDLVALVAARRTLAQFRDQRVVESVAGTLLGLRQLQPLHDRG